MTDQPPKKPDLDDQLEDLEALLRDGLDDNEGEEDTVESLREEKKDLLEQIGRLTDALSSAQKDNRNLRASAEDIKASAGRDIAKAQQNVEFAAEKFIKEMLPVIDTLELGLNAISSEKGAGNTKFDKLAEGVEKTLAQLTTVFNKFGVKEINPINEEFDANKHEALAVMPKDGVDPETVIQVAQKGYEIKGKLIRPAKVIVTPGD